MQPSGQVGPDDEKGWTALRISERSGGRRLEVFPIWFLTEDIKRQIDRILPSFYRRRFRIYFERYGCVRCNRKKVMYGGNGVCRDCLYLLGDRLKRIDAKLKGTGEPEESKPTQAFLRRRRAARELLADFRIRNH
jgi:hypothetical protein